MKEPLAPVGIRLLLVAAVAASAPAQSPCTTVVAPGIVQRDSAPVGDFYAMTTFDPDGAGPLPESLVVGGEFGADNIAWFDVLSGTWGSIGPGLTTGVRLLTTMPNGDVVAAVQGPTTGSAAVRVRRWNGATWASLTWSVVGSLSALHPLPNGDLLVGGDFTSINGVPANGLAVWDGSSWSEFGGGVTGADARVTTFGELANGDLVVGGTFTTIGGVAANRIATWNGVTFAPLGSGLEPGLGPFSPAVQVVGIETLANGDLVVAGSFQSAGGVPVTNVARWDGSFWFSLGSGVGGPTIYSGWLTSADQLPNGDIVVGGGVPIGGVVSGFVQRWDGANWVPYGAGLGDAGLSVRSMPSGLVAAGSEIARFDGSGWQPLDGSGVTDATVHAVCELPTGELVVGGTITSINGAAVSNVAMWDGASWSDMAGGVDGVVRHLAVAPNGDVLATGSFLTAGGVTVNRIARWDGASWSALGAGTPVECVVAVLPDGDVIVSGEFAPFSVIGGVGANDIARWDGSTWSPLAGGLVSSTDTYALYAAPDGDVYVSSFCDDPAAPIGSSAPRVVRWDGVAWSAVGGVMNGPARGVTTLPNGDVVVGGKFSVIGGVNADRVARFDGVTWTPMGAGFNGEVFAVQRLPDGDVVVGGALSPLDNLARWDGSSWTSVAGGADGQVRDLSFSPRGDLLVAGAFDQVGGVSAPHVAQVVSTCRAGVIPLGAGCVGAGGLDELIAETLPWTGGTLRLKATGLAPLSLILIAAGYAPAAPATLTSLGLPSALPGCTLDIAPVNYELAITTTGEQSFGWLIPDDPVFAGARVYWQFVAVEIDASFAFLQTTSTNALALTVGVF